jgi:hypothetical protein
VPLIFSLALCCVFHVMYVAPCSRLSVSMCMLLIKVPATFVIAAAAARFVLFFAQRLHVRV